ncbi:hypothetical protein TWF970_005669 [Orbilia oligospora]|uniref:Uncharacterized protein n=1 Tax=Orbilia oligospora TaxID=2813651 RepID=A0A7C8VVY2_ORBOL|nr:hypothetical protein TWF970_005669 [Orbilia oligospora]
MEVKREEVDLEIGEQRYLTHCAILASLPTEHSKNERDAQLSTIRGTDDERPSTKTHRLDRLLDSLASLLAAHGGGDCLAVALGGLTKDQITLLLSIDTPVLEREVSVLYQAIEAHSQRIFRYLRNFHNAADDPGIQQNIRTDFTVQQIIYSIDGIESRYKLFDRELKKIKKLDLGQFEFYDVVQEETVCYVPAPEYDNAEDESLAKDLRQSFFDLEGVKENLPEKQKSLIEDLKARPKLPTKQLSRQDFLIWHKLFLWLFKILGRQIQFCITARSANGSQDESTEAYKNLWIAAMNLNGMLQRVVVMIEGSSIFGMWAAIFQKILDGKGERRTTVGAMIPSAPLPSFAGRPAPTAAGQRQGEEGKNLENLRTRQKYNGEAQQTRTELEQPPLLENSGSNIEQKDLNISQDPKSSEISKIWWNNPERIVKRILGKSVTWVRNKPPKREGLESILNTQKTSNIVEAIATGSRHEGSGDDNRRQETQFVVPIQSLDDGFDDPVHQNERGSGASRSYASLETLTKVVPSPGNPREPSMDGARAEEYEDEDEDEDDDDGGEDNEDDEVGYYDFDLRIITEAEKLRGAARNGLFRRAYALAGFQFLVRAVLYDKTIATEVVRKDFTVEVITPVDGRYTTSKVENLEETLHRFFASENTNGTPSRIKIQVQDFIKSFDQIIKEGNRRQQLLDHTKKDHTVRAAQHAELVLLQHLLEERNLGAGKYIGVSKPPCLVCENVLHFYKPEIRTRRGHGHVSVLEIPKGLPSDHIKCVFSIVEELSKKITVKAYKAQTKPMSGDSTFIHHGKYSNEYEKGTLSRARPLRAGYVKASKSPQ